METLANDSTPSVFFERFRDYFSRPIAQKAAKPLSNGAELEFRVIGFGGGETFHFLKDMGDIVLQPGSAQNPQVVFIMTPNAAQAVLDDTADEIGKIGVGILKLIASPDPEKKISIRLKAGFLSLFNNGYFGVLKAGGAEAASFLASKGMTGLDAIKEALKRLRAQ